LSSTEDYQPQDRTRIVSEDLIKIAGAEVSLRLYIEQAWSVLEPTTPFISGWHLDAICDHLEAVFKGDIRNIIINIPPRHMKSLAVSVFFPTWVWINDPSSRWLFSSYAQDLSTRDSLKCRRLIQSLWYQARWSDRYTITTDQNQKTRFENDKTGYRLSTSVDGVATGEGGDYIVVDDPHNVKQAESEIKRNGVLMWWDEVMSTRLNNPNTGRKIIVMQRLHENDLTGHILAKELGYVHLMLPAEYEKDRKCFTNIGFEDPREDEYEPLWEGLYGREALDTLKKDLVSEYAIAGQLQQRPAPRGGGMFQVDKIKIANAINKHHIVRSVRYWDKAGTEGGGCYTAGVLMHVMSDGGFLVADVIKGQWSAGKREAIIKQTAQVDGKEVTVWVEQEPGSGGKESAESTIKNLAGFRVKADKVTGAKEVRAEPYANQVEIGNVSILKAEWNRGFLSNHESFPVGKEKDDVDASAGGFNKLTAKKARYGVW
jgi:predicted phage terminase large subunit-like protein